nr:MAG TPA: tail protein [Caudoviricetes sp.]
MSKSLHARLVAYRPFGARIGVLAEPVSFSASMLHDDDGAISIEYSMLSGDAQAFDRELTDGLEVAVEVSDGTGYREPDNARYVITGRSGKTDDRTKTVTYSGQSISWLLSKAENNDSSHLLADGDNKGKRPFYSSNPGTILKTLLDENKARGGVATGLTLGFDTARDSNGDAWNRKYTLYYSLGTDLQTILSSLVNGGGCDWRTSGRALKLWNADSTALSRDLSKQVILQLARDIGEAPYEESIADLASTILVEGDNDLLFRMDNPAAPTPWGKWESYSSQGGVSDKDTAQAFMQSTLDDAARVRGQYTRDLIISDVDNLPLVDYHAGDWITAPTVSHGEKVRVQEIDLSMRQGEGLSASIALNDIKYDASVRQAKKIKGITGGAALAGSEGGTTASSDRDHRVPKAPLGLVVQTDAYIGSDGFAHGLATASWSAVTEATNNTSIEISNYAIEWRRHVDGVPWHSAGTTDKTQLGFGGLDCGTQIEVRVRAVPTYSDKLGEWSETVVVTVESDRTPCSVPSKPVLSSDLGVVTIHWDGRTSTGASMESDFDHVEVGEGAANAGMTVISATQSGQGDYLITGLKAGSEHSYALRSVDHAGNRSAWSALATVTVASAVSPDEVKQIQKDLADNQTALKDNTAKLDQARKDIAANQAAQSATAKDLESAKSDIKANQSAIGTANATLRDNAAKLTQAQKDIQANKTGLDTANQTLSQAKADLSQARKDIAQTKSDLTTANGEISKAKESAAQAYAEAHSKNHTFRGPDEPKDNLIVGDLWLKTQKYWTRWKGEKNNSPSMLADFYTYWQGVPNNSPSVLVPLADRVIDTLVWDGSNWNHLGYADVEKNADEISKAKSDIADNAAKTTDAKKTAENAAAAAKNAQGTADAANGAAKTAQDTANAATAAAKSATATAGQAKDAANAANAAAESARKTAGNAETLANTANASANAAKSDASTAKTDASNAKATASNASSVATQAKATADSAAQSATDAATAARKANTAAAAAAGVANGKADVLIQSTAPATSMRKPTTLWIDTTGGANTPKRWNGSAWAAVTDKAATDAANAAVKANDAAKTAQSTADKAATAAANAASQANQAQAAAKKAQTTADGKNLIYRGPDEPAHDGLKPGDMWWRTQKYWTRWQGEKNNSPSMLADFYTYWQGAPNASPSVLVPLADRVVEVLTWDGTRFEPFDLAANNILASGTVAAKHLAADSVTAEKVKANAITVDKLAANSVTTEKLVSDAVTAGKLAANSVQARNIVSLAITTDKLAANSVTTAKLRVTEDMTVALLNVHKIQAGEIAANAVTTDKVAAGAVNADKLAANSVTAGKVQAGAIGTDKLAANSVTTAKLRVTEDMTVALLNVHKINAGDIVSGAVTADKLAANAVNADKLAANSVNSSKIVAGAVTTDKIAVNSVTAVKIAAGTITSDKVAAGQFKGYVFTGAVFQSSEAANTGIKLNSMALQMWDSSHNQTVYLDGHGKSNLLTGTFQTALTGKRIRVSPDFEQFAVGSDQTFEGSGIEFKTGRDGQHAYIASEIRGNRKGEISTLTFNGGLLGATDPGSFMRLGEYKAADNATKTGNVFLAAYRDYSKGSQNGFAQLFLQTDPTSKYHTLAELSAADSNGRVGVEADINSGYLYLGGFVGGYGNGRKTFATYYPRGGSLNAGGWITQTWTYDAPAKYGLYHAHVSADSMGSIAAGSNNDSPSGCNLWARGVGNGNGTPYGYQILAILARQ